MKPMCDLLYGVKAANNLPPEREGHILLEGFSCGKRTAFRLGLADLSKGMLCIGGTGSGKTNTINSIVKQLKRGMTPDDVMIIFDTKGDFYEKFYDKCRGDVIIGSSPRFRDMSAHWNVYQEILIDGSDDETVTLNVNEISRSLFKPYESEQQPFFANAARGVFSAYLLACIRMSREDAEMREECLNNRTLRSYFHRAGLEEYTRLANAYSDLNAIKMYIGDGQNNQALGVLAEVLVMVRDCFFNVFGEKGDFSIRDFVRKKSGRTLFIEYDLSVGETLSPLYSLLIDLALKDALGQQKSQGNVYIIIDEFKLLPHLLHIDDAVNFGRSMGVKVIAALQSISQLFDMYGEQKGRSITAGFNTLMAFRPNDSVTREYLRDYFGRNMVSETVLINRAPVTERREGHTVEDWELAAFRPGEAAVMINGEEPFLYRFDPYKEG